jgi:hypothetical protein
VGGLIAYLASEVLPHPAAEEKAVYPAAAAHAGLADLVSDMIAEHAMLSSCGARLAVVSNGVAAAEQAQQVMALLTVVAAKENDVLLPALLAESGNLAGLLEEIDASAAHNETHNQPSSPAAGRGGAAERKAEDYQATMVTLLLQGTAALTRVDDADRPAGSPRRRGRRCARDGGTWRSR